MSARSSADRARSFVRFGPSSRRAPRARARASTSTSSSDETGRQPRTLAVARIVTPHGLHGEVSCTILTDFPDRFATTVELLVGEPPVTRAVESHRLHQDRLLLKLAGVDDRAAAEELRGALLQVPVEAAVELPAGSYYWYQLIGLRVVDESGRELGELVEVLPTGSNDVYVVRGQFGEILLPAIKDVVREVDLAGGCMRVHLLPGLLDGA